MQNMLPAPAQNSKSDILDDGDGVGKLIVGSIQFSQSGKSILPPAWYPTRFLSINQIYFKVQSSKFELLQSSFFYFYTPLTIVPTCYAHLFYDLLF